LKSILHESTNKEGNLKMTQTVLGDQIVLERQKYWLTKIG
jgi:hypothetical protein